MKPSCHVCGTEATFLLKKDGFDQYICPECSLSFVFPQPEADWLKTNVYSYESGYQGDKKTDLTLASADKRISRTLGILVREKPGGKILDVGCSSGQFMHWARQRGFSCVGVEINKRTADIAETNGFMVHRGFLDSAPFAKKSFDVVYLGDVIEHVNDPRAFVATCERFLKDNGIIVVSTPNMDCLWARSTLWLNRKFGIPWAPATPPHHLFQFSLGNLNRLFAERGFMPSQSIFVKPSSLRYELGSLHLWGKWKREKTLTNLFYMLFAFASYSCLYVFNRVWRPAKDFQMVVFYMNT